MKALKIVALVSILALFQIACGEAGNGNGNRPAASSNMNKPAENGNANKPAGTVVVDNANTGATANANTPAPASNVDAVALFKEQKCANCHAEDGKGKVKGTPDFTNAEWQSKKTDDELANGIKKGDPPKMPPFGAKLTDDQVKALVSYVRTFAKK